jgi:uncharacterized FlaG/YvyC family protein
MEIPPFSSTNPGGLPGAEKSDLAQSGNLRTTLGAVRQLNNLDIADREFAVVRDPASQRFVVQVVDKSSGTVIDQFPPEDILKMLAQLSSNSELSSDTE